MSALLTRSLLRATALGLGMTMLTATVALAAPPSHTPDSGDRRATSHSGDVKTCAAAGLPGRTITLPNLEDHTHKYVTITRDDLRPGDEIVGVVVQGGEGYNVYRGLSAWTNLHAPLAGGDHSKGGKPGKIPPIGHWFACVDHKKPPTTTRTAPPTTTHTRPTYPTTTETTTTTSKTTTTCPPTTTTTTTAPTTTPSTTHTVPTTTTAAVVPTTTKPGTPGTTKLAFTGFGASWLVWVAVLLLIAGGGFVAVHRMSRRRS